MSRYPAEKFSLDCAVCSSPFLVVKSRLSKAKYCSMKCKGLDARVSDKIYTCEVCQSEFEETFKHRNNKCETRFCSRDCFYIGRERRPDGSRRECSATGFIFIKIKDGLWIREHRLVVEKIIKRKLNYDSEPILHINGNPADNAPRNLYVCRDQSELSTILKSYKIPYPVTSNIKHLTTQNQ